MSTGSESETAFSYQGSLSCSQCGYCNSSGGKKPRCSFYLHAKSLTVEHYQCLVDRGWRRSGHTLYKPHNRITCCPQYTIRLNANSFKPSRDQRQSLHKWTRYVLGDEYIKEAAKKHPETKGEKKRGRNEFDLVGSVHESEYTTLTGRIHPEPAHRFEVTVEPASLTDEKFALYDDYQTHVHHDEPDEVTRSGFDRFLCASPLKTCTTSSGLKLGSYHQLYRLDGRLIAMGVLDLLPHCVSGVYFMYHPDFEKWNMGKISACREAALAKEAGYEYYYMGYYIHSCPKMRYKGAYSPSELLDPETNEWNFLDDEMKAQMDKHRYYSPAAARKNLSTGFVSIAQAAEQIDADSADYNDDGDDSEIDKGPGYSIRSRMPGLMSRKDLDEFDVDRVKVRLRGDNARAWMLVGFEEKGGRIHSLFRETVAAVGPDVAQDMVMVF